MAGSYCVVCRQATGGAKLCRAHKGCSPAEQLRIHLARAKVNGVPFERAWEQAFPKIAWPHDTQHRREWKAILHHPKQRETWGAAYRDEPVVRRSESAAAVLIAA